MKKTLVLVAAMALAACGGGAVNSKEDAAKVVQRPVRAVHGSSRKATPVCS